MAKNEDGEFELILGNNQLLSVFFLMVLLLALCFVGGYVVGKNAAPMLTAGNTPAATLPAPTSSTPAKVEVTRTEPKSEPSPAKTAPQVEPEPVAKSTPPPPKPEPAKTPPPKIEPAKTAPPKAEPAKAVSNKSEPKAVATKPLPPIAPATKSASAAISSQPVAGRRYLQLSATTKDKAEVMADLVRRASLPAIAAAIPDRPDLYRVLVGPLADDAVESTRAKLNSSGFPGTAAIPKVF